MDSLFSANIGYFVYVAGCFAFYFFVIDRFFKPWSKCRQATKEKKDRRSANDCQ